MGPFLSSFRNEYTLLVVNYVSKRVKAALIGQPRPELLLSSIGKNICSRYGMPRAIISDQGTYFNNCSFDVLLNLTTAYHP